MPPAVHGEVAKRLQRQERTCRGRAQTMSVKTARSDEANIAALLRDAWKQHRLIPKLFAGAGSLQENVREGVLPFGFTELYPTEWINSGYADHIWRDLGKQLAIGEVREFLDALAVRSSTRPSVGGLSSQVSQLLGDLGISASTGAIFSPSRWRVLRALELTGIPGTPADPRAQGSSWYRGAFEGVPTFAVPMSPLRALWIVDLGSLGTWNAGRSAEYLDVRVRTAAGQFVLLNDSPVPASSITAEEFFSVGIKDASSAVGIEIPAEPELD